MEKTTPETRPPEREVPPKTASEGPPREQLKPPPIPGEYERRPIPDKGDRKPSP